MAGTFDATGDLAGIACTVLGAGPVIQHGITRHSLLLLLGMTLTSFFGTRAWTRLAQRIGQSKPAPAPDDVPRELRRDWEDEARNDRRIT